MKKCIGLLVALFVMAGVCYAQEKSMSPDKSKNREVAVDRNEDGKIDGMDVYNEKGRIVRRGYDENNDGLPDRWQMYDPNSGMPNVVPSDSAYELQKR